MDEGQPPGSYQPAWSPSGERIVFWSSAGGQRDIETMRADGSDRVTLTDDRDVDLARDWQPRFTGDGTTLTFYSNLSGKYDAWSIRTDGSGRTKLTDIRKRGVFPMFSPDGTRLVVAVIPNTAAFGAAPFPVTDSTMKLIDGLKFPTGTLTPSYWSRSGRWISGYVIKPTGDAVGFGVLEVATGRARQLNEDSHSYDLAWLPGERQVVYFTDGAKLVIQDVVTLERREIAGALPHPPDPFGGVVASPDGRTLYYGARQLESNIWLVTRSDGKRG